jgi:hypothetical protein
MKKNSPLKQLNNQNQEQAAKQKHVEDGMFDAGLKIIGEGQRRLNWEQTQLDVRSIEPESMQIRKHRDLLLLEKQQRRMDAGLETALPSNYLRVYGIQIKNYQEELYAAVTQGNKNVIAELKAKVAGLQQTIQLIKDNMIEFQSDRFERPQGSPSGLSRGVSKQQMSFATQMYCENPDLVITFASKEDVLRGQTDYYGNLVDVEKQYAIVLDFYNNPVLVNVLDGNKDMFIMDTLKATEYLNFVNEMSKEAGEAMKQRASVQINLEKINYKIDEFFGRNDGTATKKQDQLVLMFAHDDAVMPDANTFQRHLHEHPNLKNINYGGFDWEKLQPLADLGPGDTNYWYDNIDELDRLKLVDAICNQDNIFFDIKLLRTLVKEYYTIMAENAWWKGMGFDKGRLDLMRLKQRELIRERFKMEKAKAAQQGRKDFLFDGKVYATGVNLKKQKQEEDEKMKRAGRQFDQNMKPRITK